MRLLITGINGFVGTHLSRYLKANGHDLTGLYYGDLGNLDSAGIELHECDITDFNSLNSILSSLDFDAVIHLAGFASAGQSFRQVLTVHAINYTGTLNLLESLASRPKPLQKIVHISSAEIYAPSEDPLREDAPTDPGSPYAASKMAAEVLAQYYFNVKSLPIVIARPFNHIGPGQSLDFFLPSVIQQFRDAKEKGESSFTLNVGNIEVVRDFHAVEDVCAAYELLLQKGVAGEAYNVGSGKGYVLKQMIERAAEIAGLEVAIQIDKEKYRPADKPVLLSHCDKINALGWKPVLTMDDILTGMLKGEL